MSTHGDEALDDVEVEKISQVKIKPKKYSNLTKNIENFREMFHQV